MTENKTYSESEVIDIINWCLNNPGIVEDKTFTYNVLEKGEVYYSPEDGKKFISESILTDYKNSKND